MRKRHPLFIAAALASMFLGLAVPSSSMAQSPSDCSFGPTDDPSWSTTLTKAAEQGTVNFYTIYAPVQIDRLANAFAEVCPAITIIRVTGAVDLLSRVQVAINSNTDGADVFTWTDIQWFKDNKTNLVQLEGPFSSQFPKEAFFLPGTVVNTLSIPFGYLVWNTNEFPNGFRRFEDLTDPALKGRIGFREGLTPSFIGYLEFLKAEFGEDYLKALGAQQPKFYTSLYPLTQAIASGEIGAAPLTSSTVGAELLEQGAPIDFYYPEPSYKIPQPAAVLASSRRPEAAKVFMEFLLSPAGQEAVAGDGFGESELQIDSEVDLSGSTMFDPTSITPELREYWNVKFDEFLR